MKTNNKMREALTKILNLTNSLDENCAVDPVEIRDIAKAALAEPMRNYEVGTVEEQLKRFMHFCDSRVCNRRYCACGYEELFRHKCAIRWAQMPYEEKKGEVDDANG